MSCLTHSDCQLVNRVIFQRPYKSIIPEYILQLRPETMWSGKHYRYCQRDIGKSRRHTALCLRSAIIPTVSFRGYPGPELLRDQRFVDYNATSPDTNAELDKSSGHESQLQANNTEVLK